MIFFRRSVFRAQIKISMYQTMLYDCNLLYTLKDMNSNIKYLRFKNEPLNTIVLLTHGYNQKKKKEVKS